MTAKIAVACGDAPKAIGPYSQAIRCGQWGFLSGQIALDPATGLLVGASVEEQTERVIRNLRAVLAGMEVGLEAVVKTTVYLTSMADFPRFNEVYAKHFPAPFPARATVEVSKLPKDALVEIEAVAYLGSV